MNLVFKTMVVAAICLFVSRIPLALAAENSQGSYETVSFTLTDIEKNIPNIHGYGLVVVPGVRWNITLACVQEPIQIGFFSQEQDSIKKYLKTLPQEANVEIEQVIALGGKTVSFAKFSETVAMAYKDTPVLRVHATRIETSTKGWVFLMIQGGHKDKDHFYEKLHAYEKETTSVGFRPVDPAEEQKIVNYLKLIKIKDTTVVDMSILLGKLNRREALEFSEVKAAIKESFKNAE